MTTNIERAVDLIANATTQPGTSIARGVDRSILAAQLLADAGLLMPDLPEPKWPGFWEVDGLEINVVDKDGEVNLDWREGDYHRGEDRSLWLSRNQVIAILAAANLAEQEQGNG